ncbi:MAG: aminotransferase class I/II-fold pyridoxal phosphate-dependent enzyme [Myxococcales bacterium]|nr:aminotransferase class I/II-fold pyridoxal phosphate-dependent enzyme [Myxococcales bacterium]MDH3485836.1 aminotransferase class I/II-fold pyridoxal phosphate-dependent enzyme [Myxococcales bacterium]
MSDRFQSSDSLRDVRYEIRGQLAQRAHQMERQGYEIISMNIGNPGLFDFRTPETMRMAMIENLPSSEAYCHQKGIFPAREAVVMQQQERGVMNVTAEHVFIGNGVSELIDLTLRALLNAGDEVLIPSPDYPLWTAAVTLNGARAVHYPCPPDKLFQPDLDALEGMITDRTRALVIINPNNPTGAVYSREVLEAMVALAERHDLVVFSDEIYDGMVYDDAEFIPIAPLVRNTLCGTFSGLSKVYRACGFRVGWVAFSGTNELAKDYLHGLDLLASLRLCSNVPGQWGVQTALGGYQSLKKLVRPRGRLYESRQAVIRGVEASEYLTLVVPGGSMYAFVGADTNKLPGFDDQEFAMELLETQHVLVAPGSSFNVDYRNYFRITILPEAKVIDDVFRRMEKVLQGAGH